MDVDIPHPNCSAPEQVPNWEETFYAPVPDYMHYICASILLVLLIPGVLGNSLSIIIYIRTKSLQKPPNMLLLNLSVIDLIMALSCQPVFFFSSIKKEWYFGSIGCTISGTFATFAGLGSIMSMAVIAYDRYVCVSFPLQVRTIVTKSRARRLIALVWCYASVFAILPLFGIGGYVLNGFKTSCTFDYITRDLTTRTFLVFMYLMGFVGPFFVIFFCYWCIFDTIRKTRVHDDNKQSINRQQKRDMQMARVGFVSVSMFLVAWLPYALVALVGQFWGAHLISPYVSTLPALFAKSQCIYNCFIYGCGHPNYRLAYIRQICGEGYQTRVQRKNDVELTVEETLGEKVSGSKVRFARRRNYGSRRHSVPNADRNCCYA